MRRTPAAGRSPGKNPLSGATPPVLRRSSLNADELRRSTSKGDVLRRRISRGDELRRSCGDVLGTAGFHRFVDQATLLELTAARNKSPARRFRRSGDVSIMSIRCRVSASGDRSASTWPPPAFGFGLGAAKCTFETARRVKVTRSSFRGAWPRRTGTDIAAMPDGSS